MSKSAGYYAELEEDQDSEAGPEQTKHTAGADQAAEHLSELRVANGEHS